MMKHAALCARAFRYTEGDVTEHVNDVERSLVVVFELLRAFVQPEAAYTDGVALLELVQVSAAVVVALHSRGSTLQPLSNQRIAEAHFFRFRLHVLVRVLRLDERVMRDHQVLWHGDVA